MLYGYEKGIDTSEFADNRELTQALAMLKIIFDDLNPEDFTLEEIQDEFNAVGPVGKKDDGGEYYKTVRVRYGPSHIDTLLEKDLIEENEEQDHYHVTKSGSAWYDETTEEEEKEREDGVEAPEPEES